MVKINSTKFGEITINGKIYYSDMIVWWDGKKEYREKSHVFDIEEFQRLAERKPEIIVIGAGHSSAVKVPPEVEDTAEMRKISIYVENSPKAIELFNAFVAEKKKVVAVIHTTC
jgi:hypothetical protein